MTLEAVPRAYATVTGTDATFITPDGHSEPITASADEDIRRMIVQRATDEARRTGVALELITSGDRGEHHLLVSGTGELTTVPATRAAEPARAATAPEEDPDPPATPEPDEPGDLERPQRTSFITPGTLEQAPATGWRGTVSGLGIRIPESARQRQRRIDEAN